MPSPHGGDRLAVDPDGSFVISSRRSKGWIAHKRGEGTHADFPGTCVRWNDELFEVMAAEGTPAGVRYRLEPWGEANAVRVLEDYDDASEARRADERTKAQRRQQKTVGTLALAFFAGNLPAEVQEEMESDLGIRASRITMLSIIPLFLIGTPSLLLLMASIAGASRASLWTLAGVYFFIESMVRFAYAMALDKPIGSAVLVIPWVVLQSLRGRKPPPALAPLPPEQEIVDRDAYRLREPFLALLSAEDQWKLASRYGFQFTRWGNITAGFLLGSAILGIVVGPRTEGISSTVSFFAAIYVAAEQLLRLMTIRRNRPAGSVFGVLVRPFAGRLLSREGSGDGNRDLQKTSPEVREEI